MSFTRWLDKRARPQKPTSTNPGISRHRFSPRQCGSRSSSSTCTGRTWATWALRPPRMILCSKHKGGSRLFVVIHSKQNINQTNIVENVSLIARAVSLNGRAHSPVFICPRKPRPVCRSRPPRPPGVLSGVRRAKTTSLSSMTPGTVHTFFCPAARFACAFGRDD